MTELVASVGDVGFALSLTVEPQADGSAWDFAGASAFIDVVRPHGTPATWTATINGQVIEYATQSGDLSIQGIYRCRLRVTWGDGRVLRTPDRFLLEAKA